LKKQKEKFPLMEDKKNERTAFRALRDQKKYSK
jgi:hypothetical protein